MCLNINIRFLNKMIMKTYSLKKEDIQRNWFVLDATDLVLGRMATKIADRIRGKDNTRIFC